MPQLPKRRKAAKLLAAPDAAGERLAQVNAARGRHWGTAKGARGKASYVLAVISVPRTRRATKPFADCRSSKSSLAPWWAAEAATAPYFGRKKPTPF
jgi:hypothetical protein